MTSNKENTDSQAIGNIPIELSEEEIAEITKVLHKNGFSDTIPLRRKSNSEIEESFKDFPGISESSLELEDESKGASENKVNTTSTAAPDSLTDEIGVSDGFVHTESTNAQTDSPSSSYMDDDEEFFKGDDKQIHQDSDIGIFKQQEGVVSWEIANFYKDNGKPRGKFSLKNDPPIMKISSSQGDEAEFLITREFAKSLSSVLEDVNRAYFGISPASKNKAFSKANFKEKSTATLTWIKSNKIKAILIGAVVGFMLYSSFAI